MILLNLINKFEIESCKKILFSFVNFKTMGQSLCNGGQLDESIEFKQKSILIKCNSNEVRYKKNASNQPIINGYVKIYGTNPVEVLLYEGEMKNSNFHGYGKLYKDEKVIYEGEFKDGLFEGWGVTEQYVGQFRGGKFDGFGVYKEFADDENKVVTLYYEGYFFDGLHSGTGVMIKGMAMPYEKIEDIHARGGIVDYIDSQIQHDMALQKKYGAKQIYIGQFANGLKHGMGRLLKDGKQLSGQFSCGVFHGVGTLFNFNQKKKSDQKGVLRQFFKEGNFSKA